MALNAVADTVLLRMLEIAPQRMVTKGEVAERCLTGCYKTFRYGCQ